MIFSVRCRLCKKNKKDRSLINDKVLGRLSENLKKKRIFRKTPNTEHAAIFSGYPFQRLVRLWFLLDDCPLLDITESKVVKVDRTFSQKWITLDVTDF